MRPARQHTLVTLSIYSFLESEFSASGTTKQAMREYLVNQLTKENTDVTVSVSEMAP